MLSCIGSHDALTVARRFLFIFAFLATLFVAPPARAQSSSSNAPYWAAAVGLGLFVFGGGVTFVAADVHYAAKRRPLPLGWAVSQMIYGSVYIAVGAGMFDSRDPGAGIALMSIGGVVTGYPILDWRIHAGRRKVQTSLRLTPTGLLASGTF